MSKKRLTVPDILNLLEAFYGKQEPCWPSDPYLFLLWWYGGYPASDASCSKGWKELTGRIGTDPEAILAAHPAKLTAALKPGGMLPELRAERMKEVAARIKNEFDGDLRASLVGPITKVRKVLKSFPSIADPGAGRILLFAGIQPVASNLPPGLAKKDRLPPGLEKHLARNGTLPPGLQKRIKPSNV